MRCGVRLRVVSLLSLRFAAPAVVAIMARRDFSVPTPPAGCSRRNDPGVYCCQHHCGLPPTAKFPSAPHPIADAPGPVIDVNCFNMQFRRVADGVGQPLPSATPGGPGALADKLYQCSNCRKTFRLVNALNHHIKTKHAGDGKIVVVGPDGNPIEVAEEVPPQPVKKPAAPATQSPKQQTIAEPPDAATTADAAPVQKEASATETKDPEQEAALSDEDVDKRSFVCAVCQKGFRLEAALIHHYQAKHGMQPPSSVASDPSTSAPGSPAKPGVGDETKGEGEGDDAKALYLHDEGSITPQPPHYHLDVAPSAPEESQIAAHPRCVNHILLVGAIQELQSGYVFEEPCEQFTLATDFENAPPGDPEKDFHTVRVFGEEFTKMVKPLLIDGAKLLVNGRLRLVPQWEPAVSKYFHFPVVHVYQGCGSLHVVEDAVEAVGVTEAAPQSASS